VGGLLSKNPTAGTSPAARCIGVSIQRIKVWIEVLTDTELDDHGAARRRREK
jgi:hypothetical protein